jgi:hypothetical protein
MKIMDHVEQLIFNLLFYRLQGVKVFEFFHQSLSMDPFPELEIQFYWFWEDGFSDPLYQGRDQFPIFKYRM